MPEQKSPPILVESTAPAPPPDVDESMITTIEGGASASATPGPLRKPRWPVAPKAHGAWLGAGSGAALAQAVIGVIQAITHTTLAPGFTAAIFALSTPLLAFIGSYLAPHQDRIPPAEAK